MVVVGCFDSHGTGDSDGSVDLPDPPTRCDRCRDFGDGAIDVGQAGLAGEVYPFIPFEGGRLTYSTIPGGDVVAKLTYMPRGFCLWDADLTTEVVGCPADHAADCRHTEPLRLEWSPEQEPDVHQTSIAICPVWYGHDEVLTVRLTVAERQDGICADDARSTTIELNVMPVCPPYGLGQAGAPELMDLHDCCELQCYDPGGGCFTFRD